MAIDLETEELVRLPAESHKLLRDPPSAPTWWRWINRGVAGRRLETVKIGSRVYTSREAWSRFARQQGDPDPSAAVRTPHQRARAFRQAEKELTDSGV